MVYYKHSVGWLHDLGGDGLPADIGGGGEVGLLLGRGVLEHLGGEAQHSQLVPLRDDWSPAILLHYIIGLEAV